MEIWPPVDGWFDDRSEEEIQRDYEEEADIIAEHVRNCDLHERDIYCKICHEM